LVPLTPTVQFGACEKHRRQKVKIFWLVPFFLGHWRAEIGYSALVHTLLQDKTDWISLPPKNAHVVIVL